LKDPDLLQTVYSYFFGPLSYPDPPSAIPPLFESGLEMSTAAPSDGGSNSSNLKESLKDKLKNPFHGLSDKLHDSSLHEVKVRLIQEKHKIGKLGNLWNTNHRHDEEHEKLTDEKRSKIAESHRFNSFAPERDNNNIKWYVDGRDYFWYQLHLSERRRQFTLKIGGSHPNSSCDDHHISTKNGV
jgi:hypothetical protein